MVAALAPIADVTSPQDLGVQVALDGSGGGSPVETFAVTSSNPAVRATVARGDFLSLNVTHTSSGAGDPSFTGTLVFQLFDDLTPLTTAKIKQLVNSGFYTNKNFHRITAGFPDATSFIAQGGSVTGTGLDSPPPAGQPGGLPATGFPFADEFNEQLAFTGRFQLAMANAGPETNTSQFFVTTGSPRGLDFMHTIFAQMVSGFDTLTRMTQVAVGGDGTTPASPVLITSATLTPATPFGVIHVDTTDATQGQTSTITVTATDAVTDGTASQTFRVNVGPLAAPPFQNERAFVDILPDFTVGRNQTAVFRAIAHNPEPTDTLTYIVRGAFDRQANAFTPVQNATATVDANGVVTVVPTAGFNGTIPLLVGVRDQVNRAGAGSPADTPSNFRWHNLTLTVNAAATPVNLPPIALPVTAAAATNNPTTIQLAGNTANPGSSQTLTYAITSQPTNGTLSGLNAAAGTVTYTANQGYLGPDSFAYTVTDVGTPTPSLTSTAATVTINVGLGVTGSVRLVNRTLIVTPPAPLRGQRNAIAVTQVNGQIQVTVNGVLDRTQPQATALDNIVVYGTNRGTTIEVDPSVVLPTTLDGGHGGRNFVRAGGAPSRIHGWFGKNLVSGGTQQNAIVGRKGHLRIIKSPGTDNVFLSRVNPNNRPPSPNPYGVTSPDFVKSPGSYFRFVRNRLVKINFPATIPLRQSGTELDPTP